MQNKAGGSARRRRSGDSLAEFAPALYMTLIIGFFPMFIITSFGIRYMMFYFAVREACRAAAQAPTYKATPNPSPPFYSAIVAAQNVLTAYLNNQDGSITCSTPPNQVIPEIVALPLTTANSVHFYTAPLTTAGQLNTGLYTYNMLLNVSASVKPLIAMGNSGPLRNIPGLTAPVNITISQQYAVENPNGLQY